jgi:hypothetical protein
VSLNAIYSDPARVTSYKYFDWGTVCKWVWARLRLYLQVNVSGCGTVSKWLSFSFRHCLQVTVHQFEALSLVTFTQFETMSPSETGPNLRHCLTISHHKTLQSINRYIPAVHAVHFEWSLLPYLFTYSHIYLSVKDIPWPKMQCGRGLQPSGVRLLCGRQQSPISASSHIVKSSLTDVEIPSTAVPDYVWQRVDQWSDKVAIVSIHRASKHLRLTSGSRWLT